MTRVIYMGRKRVGAKALQWLCERNDVVVVAVITDNHLDVSPTNDVAKKYSIPVMTRDSLEQAVISGDLQFELGLSMLFWQKIRAPLINAASKGIINFHPAPLPEYKGTSGYNLAILESKEQWAVTAHYVNEEIDCGEIIESLWFPVDVDHETAVSLEAKSQVKLLELFESIVDRALLAKNLMSASPNIGGRYVSRAEMEAMKQINPGDDVERKIRAFWFPPYNGAYVLVNGVKYTLVNQEILHSLADPNASSLFTATASKSA